MIDPVGMGILVAAGASGVVAAWLLLTARSRTPGFLLGVFLVAISVWCLTLVGIRSAETVAWQLRFTSVSYVAIAVVTVTWLAFGLTYSGRQAWLTRRSVAGLLIVPTVTVLLVATAQSHDLFYQSMSLVDTGGQSILLTEPGPWHPVHLAYSYLLFGVGTAAIAEQALTSNRLYRSQSAIILVGILTPWIVNAMFHLGIRPIPGIDITPVAFALVGIPIAIVLKQRNLVSFVPVAHERVFRTLEDPVLVVGPDDRILDANDRARSILGGEGPIVSERATDVLPEELGADGDLAAAPRRTLTVDGESRSFVARTYDLDPESVAHGTIVSLSDVTDQVRRQEELADRNARLERQNERLDEFSGMVSHDLRNPLSVAEMYLEEAKTTGDETSFDRVAEAHERMERMIDELLTLAQIESAELSCEPLALESVAMEAWRTASTPGSSIELAVDPDVTLEGDPELLRTIFENLFRNASDHNEPPLTVTVGTIDGELPGLYVADDGHGIPSDERESVFEQGYTTDGEGTGFGLAIVARIAETFEWEVSVSESAAGGARFEFLARTTEPSPQPPTPTA